MYSYILPVLNKPVTWILITDGGQMRIYESRHVEKTVPLSGSSKHAYQSKRLEWGLKPLPKMFQWAELAKDYRIGHDRRGSIFGPTASVRHTVEPHLDVMEEIKRQFMRSVASTVRQAYIEKRFTHLIIAAPAKTLGELRERLGSNLMKIVIAELSKDLTHCPERELSAHIKGVLPPIRP